MSIESQVIEIIADHLNMSADEISLDASLTDDLGIDSLDLTELVMVLEDAFDITIEDNAVQDIRVVRDICNYLSESIKG